MSGGSFNYVSVRDLEETSTDDRNAIIAALREYPFPGAIEAADDLTATIAKLRAAIIEASAKWDKYKPLLKAIEWDHSGDWDSEEVKKALADIQAK